MENLENEVVENEVVETGMTIAGISESLMNSKKTDTESSVITNIKDVKQIFNLENGVDCLLNECIDEPIRVTKVLIKRYLKPMKEPEVNEETGEIIKDKEMTMSTVLVDDNGKSYATGSKVFGIQLLRYFEMLNNLGALNGGDFEPFEIKIVKKDIKNSKNKALGFELI